jgi:hypothetical protein
MVSINTAIGINGVDLIKINYGALREFSKTSHYSGIDVLGLIWGIDIIAKRFSMIK